MLTQLTVRNFKAFDSIDIELGERVVFIGPNNSGKTSALQALALWDIGLKKWNEKRGTGTVPRKRSGVTINRRDLIAVPVPKTNLLWRDLHVRTSGQNKETPNVYVDIIVKGVSEGTSWECGLEFDFANDESLYCRPLRNNDGPGAERMSVPSQAVQEHVVFLPPMSGLTATETRLDEGAINVRLGEGRTAEVLRNLCYQITQKPDGDERWQALVEEIKGWFGVELEEPEYIAQRGEVTLAYRQNGIRLDISSSGRGLQQTLLLLTHMAVNPKSVLLLDEPDAHLEILRQRQIYQLLTDTATKSGSQIIVASHSEVILNEAADRDMVIAFVGRRPHRIDDRGAQVLKSLKEIGFDQYYQAEQRGWILYVEGSTDLAILRAFAKVLNHPVERHLNAPFVHYVLNRPRSAQEHFYGLREAKSDLVGIALYDRLDRAPPADPHLRQHMWRRREIENYLADRETIMVWVRDFAQEQSGGDLFTAPWVALMEGSITEIKRAARTLGKPDPEGPDIKASDDFLDPLFDLFFQQIKLPNSLRKTNYHTLARFVPAGRIDDEIRQVLDHIRDVAERAEATK
ncbi:MAG TPA: AAA family ATPase [Stellaceae bacterium]|nr:AAA family ATPase [Stellaceae bacterium]